MQPQLLYKEAQIRDQWLLSWPYTSRTETRLSLTDVHPHDLRASAHKWSVTCLLSLVGEGETLRVTWIFVHTSTAETNVCPQSFLTDQQRSWNTACDADSMCSARYIIGGCHAEIWCLSVHVHLCMWIWRHTIDVQGESCSESRLLQTVQFPKETWAEQCWAPLEREGP